MDADRDEKLRLARKKLGKFQKTKKKSDTVSNSSGTVTPAEFGPPPIAALVPPPPMANTSTSSSTTVSASISRILPKQSLPAFSVPRATPIIAAADDHNYNTDGLVVNSVARPRSPSVYSQSPAPQAQNLQKRSMFNSFVSAVTTTAASIIKPDFEDFSTSATSSQLDDARKRLYTARQERQERSRSRSRSPSQSRTSSNIRASSKSPKPLSSSNRQMSDVGSNVFGIASRLFSGAISQQYEQQEHEHQPIEYQYGVQEGRDFNSNNAHSQIMQQYSNQNHQNNDYSYNTSYGQQNTQFVDQSHPQFYYDQNRHLNYQDENSQHYNNQLHGDSEIPPEQQQSQLYNENSYADSRHDVYVQQHPEQFYNENYSQSTMSRYNQSNNPENSNFYFQRSGAYGGSQQFVTDTIPFSSNQNVSQFPLDAVNSGVPRSPRSVIPGFEATISSTSPFDSIAAQSYQQNYPHVYSNEILTNYSNDSNLFHQEVANKNSPLGSPSRPKSLGIHLGMQNGSRSPQSVQTPLPQNSGSPIPFSFNGEADQQYAQDFPIGIGLQTWPTSPSQIQNVSRRPSSSKIIYSPIPSDGNSVAVVNSTANTTTTTMPIQVQYSRRNSASFMFPPPSNAQDHRSPSVQLQQTLPPSNNSFIQPNEAELSISDVTMDSSLTQQPTIQVSKSVYTRLVAENDSLTRQYAAQEHHLTHAVTARLHLEAQVSQIEDERRAVVRDMSELKEIVASFGSIEERVRAVDSRERSLVQLEHEYAKAVERLKERERLVEEAEKEVGKSGVVSAGEVDARMRVRIKEIEESRAGLELRERSVKEAEAKIAEEWGRASGLKIESEEALRKIEASATMVRESEGQFMVQNDTVRQLQAELEEKIRALDDGVSAVEKREHEVMRQRESLNYHMQELDNDRAAVEDGFRINSSEQKRIEDLAHSLELQAESLKVEQDLLRSREAEIRAREDDFLSEASQMANKEAIQLSELRRNYDEDLARLQADLADLQTREAQYHANSDELYRLSQEINQEKNRIEQISRELDAERADLERQVQDVRGTQASLSEQQKSLDNAVAAFSEMKEYINNSIKENEARIRNEFESLQQVHAELKEREESLMRKSQEDRQILQELQISIENDRQILVEKEQAIQKNQSASNKEILAKLDDLEKENSELQTILNDFTTTRNQYESQITILEDSNRQLQSNVLRLTQMIDTGSFKRSTSLRSLTPSSFVDQQKPGGPFDERFEFLEKKVNDISKEDGSLKEAAATIISTFKEFKKFWNDTVPIIQEIRTHKGVSSPDRNHLWTRREAETLQNVAEGKKVTVKDMDLLTNRSSNEVFNVIASLTSTNQNLSRQLEETLTLVQSLQEKRNIDSGSVQSIRGNNLGHRASIGVSEIAETVSSTGAVGFSSTKSDYDNLSVSADTILTDAGTGYYASNESVNTFRDGSKNSQKNLNGHATAQSTRNVNYNHHGNDEESVSDYSDTVTKPNNLKISFSLNSPATSLPMARISNNRGIRAKNGNSNDSDSSVPPSPETPKAGNFTKRYTAPASSYYVPVAPARKPVDTASKKSGISYSGIDSSLRKQQNRTTAPISSPSKNDVSDSSVSRQVSLDRGTRLYFVDKDSETTHTLGALNSATQRLALGRPHSAAGLAKEAVEYGSGYGHVRESTFNGSSIKAKSDTEGVKGWGVSKSFVGGGSTLRTVTSSTNRTESIRDAIRARIKERDLNTFQ